MNEGQVSFPKIEEQLLNYWREREIFQRTLDPNLPQTIGGAAEPRKPYIFYDGPPFATGLPHYGHLLAGTIKDVIGRFFTMKGFHVDRRFGWDCHGLPVEFEIQKTFNLHGSKAIEEFGIANFNEECRKIVLRYTKEWEQFVERSGRWADMTRQYRTMDAEFMESVWAVVKRLWDRGLIYEGKKCVAYSWGLNTPLSNFEANQNYKTVQDPAVTVRANLRLDLATKFSLSNAPKWKSSAYIWTTTPWTLPSNLAIAIGPKLEYSVVANPAQEELVVVASDLATQTFPGLARLGEEAEKESTPRELHRFLGEELDGTEYEPFFNFFEHLRSEKAFRIYTGDFVTAVDGTGLVHCASFGEDDVILFNRVGIPPVDPLDPEAKFTSAVPEFEGLNVKAADSKIIASLKQKGLLVQHKTIEHSYPFCWRTDTPLIYRTISTWFVRVESFRDELLQMNQLINWVPSHIKDGRMGKWLEGARDWAISRNRYWGTPIPVWRCEETGEIECIGSVAELEERTGQKVPDLHSHFIDHLTFPSKSGKGTMRRVPEVLDCWFESGSMPYAQAHYPFEGKEKFERNFPADFIAEGLDQTRGWFYTLLVLSTALFGRPAFKNVIVNGILLAEDGRKMSKSLRNYPPPNEVMDKHGADAMRLYLLASAATRGEELRFSETGVRDVVRQTLLPLWNAGNFLTTYAKVDRWTPANSPATPSENLLDRWILSKTASLAKNVDVVLSSYLLSSAAPPILDFVDQLTNWYIRLNRRRFWGGNTESEREDKLHAYATLHRSLLTFTRVLAPLAPFISEEMFLKLSRGVPGLELDSVHLAPFPTQAEFSDIEIDPALEEAMDLFEEIILLGRQLRNDHNLKVRQPLPKITVIHPDRATLDRVQLLDQYIRDELNLKGVEYSADEERFCSLQAQLNTKLLGRVLGPKLGSDGMQRLRKTVEALPAKVLRDVEAGGSFDFEGEELKLEHFIIKRTVKPGAEASASSGSITVVLDTTLTQELRLEGMAREFINRVQKLRKDFDFEVSDRIVIRYMTACPKLQTALTEQREMVMQETLAVDMDSVSDADFMKQHSQHAQSQEIDGKTIVISVARMQG